MRPTVCLGIDPLKMDGVAFPASSCPVSKRKLVVGPSQSTDRAVGPPRILHA